MKTIMIIGAGDFQLPLVEEAARDCRVVLVAPAVDERFTPYADKIYLLDVREAEQILEIARAEHIDGVITDQTDIPVRTVAYVAERMGLPGISLETGELFTNKSAMRRRLAELGLPVLPYLETDSLAEAEAFFHSHTPPLIIKPEDNQGSRGVADVNCLEDLYANFPDARKYSKSGRVILEKKAQGLEFVVEGMSLNYDYQLLICGDTHYFDLKNVFAAKSRIFPSQRDAALVERVKELNERIIRGFGLKQGITHSEYIMDGDQIYLLETAARGGGVYISSDLIGLSTGISTERFLINIALGRQDEMPRLIPEAERCVCGYMAFFLPEGVITSVEGIGEVQALPYVFHNQLDKLKVGKAGAKASDKTSRYAMIVRGRDHQELFEHMKTIQSILKVSVEKDGVTRGIIWN